MSQEPSKKTQNNFSPFWLWEMFNNLFGFQSTINLYSPYVGAGIKVESIDADFRSIVVSLTQTLLNTNYVGVHFGGSIYAMTDPFYMFILMKNLGEEYIVWDKAAEIQFLKPGTGTIRAKFEISKEQIEEIKQTVATTRKMDKIFEADIFDETGKIIAHVKKTLYIRKK